MSATHHAPAGGVLIVNADDWGGHAEVTDTIDRCFAAGAITSSTGMLFMPDSARAATIAQERGRAIGLHLNLTEPFAGQDVPTAVRERHQVACAHFSNLKIRRWTYDPRVRTLVADAIRDQLEAFHELYGGPPTHLDSHHHVHVCPDVLLSSAMPRHSPLRTTASPPPGSGRSPSYAARLLKHRAIDARYVCTSAFFGITTLHPDLGGSGLDMVLDCARTQPVEVMTHPQFGDELPVLLSDDWAQRLADVPKGSYATLGLSSPQFAGSQPPEDEDESSEAA